MMAPKLWLALLRPFQSFGTQKNEMHQRSVEKDEVMFVIAE
jgi:hypothetical protein